MNFLQFDEFHAFLKELIPVKKQIEKNQAQTDVFCPKYSNSEAPISVIAKILSENYSLKLKNISNEFDKLGFTKVKHLAQATLEKVSMVQLSGDSLTLLYGAMEIYSKRLDDFLKSAVLEFQKGNFYNTQRICKELLLHKPTDMDVIMVKSSSFYKNGNYEECIDCLLIGKSINPNYTKVLYNLAVCYWEKSETDLAKKYFSEVCRLEPSIDNLSQYAEMLRETDDLITAELTYVRVLSLKPELNEVRNNYGELLLRLNKKQEAKKQFKVALNSEPESSKILHNLGMVYDSIGKFEKAISYFKKALEINPHLKSTHGCLGMTYLSIEDYPKSITEFLKQLKLNPENGSVLRKLAIAYCHQGNNLMSAAVFKKCLKLEPENFQLNYDLAMIYLINLKNYEEAIIYLKKCIELQPEERKELYLKLIPAYNKNDDHLNEFDTCIKLIDLYLESDDLNKAKAFLLYALPIYPENAFTHWKMGLVMYKLGHLDLAFSSYEHAIELNPDLRNYKQGKGYCDEYKKYMESRLDKKN